MRKYSRANAEGRKGTHIQIKNDLFLFKMKRETYVYSVNAKVKMID